MSEQIRLNLGSGKAPLPGYQNIDLCNGQAAYPLPQFQDGSVDEVRASHLLEHFPIRQVLPVLREWVRVLRPGGILKVAVPDLEVIARRYLDGEQGFNPQGYIVGGQVDENDFHRCVFDEGALREAMEAAGLQDIRRWSADAQDCSSLAVSLNLQGTKPAPASGDSRSPYGWLKPHIRNVYSQTGEDGLIEAVFGRIGTTNRWVVECGAGDPQLCSNSRLLIEQGWSAVLIEADEEKWRRLVESFKERGFTEFSTGPTLWKLSRVLEGKPQQVVCVCGTAGPVDTLDAILEMVDAPREPDLLVLDVDGQEWYLWNSLLRHRPRVVICEYAVASGPDFIPPPGGDGQAGWKATVELGTAKGYEALVATSVNILFAANGLRPLLRHAGEGVSPDHTGKPHAEPAPELSDEPASAGQGVPDNKSAPAAEPPRSETARLGQRVKAVMTLPRLAFTDNMFCALQALIPLGINLERRAGVFWGQALTALMEPHLDDHTEYLLTLDYDTVFCKEDVRELVRLADAHPEAGAITCVQMKRESLTPLFTMKDEEGQPISRIPATAMEGDLTRVFSAHFGLTLVRVEALKQMPLPWFHSQPGEDGRWEDGHVDEDVSFWVKWNECGNQLYQANRLAVGHLQQLVTWPSQDLTPLFQFSSDWNERGKPPEAWR